MTVQTSIGTLAGRARLASLSIGQWSARKLDRAASRKTTSEAGAVADAARVNKYLLAGNDGLLKTVQSEANAARAAFDRLTLLWDRGSSILPADNAAALIAEMREAKARFDVAADDFCGDYATLRARAQDSLGELFNEADFPSAEWVRGRFRFDFDLFPFPAVSDDFRAAASDADHAALVAACESSIGRRLAAAQAETWERLTTPLRHMAETLRGYGKGSKLYDSVIGNLRDIAHLIPALNVGGDAALSATAAAALAALDGVSMDALKSDATVRDATASAAEAILRGIGAALPAPAPVPCIPAAPVAVAPVAPLPVPPAPVTIPAAPAPVAPAPRPLFAAPVKPAAGLRIGL